MGQNPGGMAHLCHLSLVASSLSTKTPSWLAIRVPLQLHVWSWGLWPHWQLGPSALLGIVLRLFWEEIVRTYLYDYNPCRVVFLGTWLNFSHGSSELPNKQKQKILVLKALTRSAHHFCHLPLVRADQWSSATQGLGGGDPLWWLDPVV